MDIESIRHKALRRFVESGSARGLPPQIVDRLRKMIAFIDAASDLDELAVPPNWGLHPLTGDRVGEWAMTVTKNWRMTFRITEARIVADMDLEDYH